MNLLDKIAAEAGVVCLSDLKYSKTWKNAIGLINATDYRLSDWNEAILYLCEENKKFDTADKAFEYLINF